MISKNAIILTDGEKRVSKAGWKFCELGPHILTFRLFPTIHQKKGDMPIMIILFRLLYYIIYCFDLLIAEMPRAMHFVGGPMECNCRWGFDWRVPAT